MPHISNEEDKLLRQLTVKELRHLLATVMNWEEVQRILGLCITVQECNSAPCTLCHSIGEKLGMK